MHSVLRLRRNIYKGSYPPTKLDSYLNLDIEYPGATAHRAFHDFVLDHGTRELREILNALIWVEYYPGSVGTSFDVAFPINSTYLNINIGFARRDVRGVNAMKLRDRIVELSAHQLLVRIKDVHKLIDNMACDKIQISENQS